LALEAGLWWALGPVAPAAAPAGAGALRWSLIAVVYGDGGAGIAGWFARWLVATLVAAWAVHRLHRAAGAGASANHPSPGPPPPDLGGRLAPFFGVLVVLMAVVLVPWSALLALGLPWWLAALPGLWPALRLALAPLAALLTTAGGRAALVDGWRLTRRRELFVAWGLGRAGLPLALLAGAVLAVAAYVPAWFTAAWWLAVAAAWLYVPLAAALALALWWRLSR
jgi:hypothetical protein